jgi:hypothetical protein
MEDKIFAANSAAIERNALSMWTVYDHPKDFPHTYIARRFEVNGAGAVATDDTVQGELRIIRKSFARCGMVCLTRSPEDDANIVETWL